MLFLGMAHARLETDLKLGNIDLTILMVASDPSIQALQSLKHPLVYIHFDQLGGEYYAANIAAPI